ncbi:MAG: ABC transporter permease subunit [Bacilli bacterium]|nr:ABC transporter permease subunit [Bacilli bacterium]
MNIYKLEMKLNRKSLIIWSISIFLLIAMGIQKYDAMIYNSSDNGAEFLKVISTMPKSLQALWGISNIDITDPIGYFSLLFFYLSLMGVIYAATLSINIIIREEKEKTADFLLSKPVKRGKILKSKLLAAASNIIIINAFMTLSSIIILKNYSKTYFPKEVFICMFGLLIIQLIYMSIGILLGILFKNYDKASKLNIAIILFTFFLSIIIDLIDKAKFISFLTPFKYFDAKNIVITNSLNIKYIILSLTIILIMIFISFKKYDKKDSNN